MEKLNESLGFDDLVNALADVQRRKLLLSLIDHNPQDAPPVELTDSDGETDAMKQLVEMNHVHLPKLEKYGIIEWHEDDNEVVKGPKFDEIRPLLELMDDHEDELPADWL